MSDDPYAPIRAVTCALQAGETRLGSGVLVGRRLVLTCLQVVGVREASELKVVFRAGSKGELGGPPRIVEVARVKRSTKGLDVALLDLETDAAPDLQPIPLGEAAFGKDFLCWGFPEIPDEGGAIPDGVAAGLGQRGVVLARTEEFHAPRLHLYSKMEIHPGLSGAPIVQVEPFRLVALMARTAPPYTEALAVPVSVLPDVFPGFAATALLEPMS